MVEIKTKIGGKGQVVIPKVFREEYGLEPGKTASFREEGGKLVLSRPNVDVVEILRKLPKKPMEHKPDEWYESELRERLEKAGVKI